MLKDRYIKFPSIKSIVCIGYAEYFLFKNKFEKAVEYFEKSKQYDSRILGEYMQQVHQDKMGFRFHYDEELEAKLDAWHKDMLDRENQNRTCIIS